MLDAEGSPVVCERVWISHVEDLENLRAGAVKLTAGYGADSRPGKPGEKFGPEYTFGITMQKLTDAPILIIKSAWGGKSLHTDFRPPSAATAEQPTGASITLAQPRSLVKWASPLPRPWSLNRASESQLTAEIQKIRNTG